MKAKYRELCLIHGDISVFMRDWWLDIMCGGPDNWGVSLSVDAGGKVQGALTYALQKFGFWTVSYPPPLSPFSGIWFLKSNDALENESLDRRRHITVELIKQLPKLPYFELKLSTDCQDWMPFYRAGFRQSTRYTFQLTDISNIDKTYKNLNVSLRKRVKQKGALTIRKGTDLQRLYSEYKANLQRKGANWSFSFEQFQKIDAALEAHNCRFFFEVLDEYGAVIGSKYIIHDGYTAYSMLSFSTPEARKSGMNPALMWEGIKICSAQGIKIFDFEGSMLAGVEEFFRSFGGTQTPYHYLVRTQNKLVATAALWKNKI